MPPWLGEAASYWRESVGSVPSGGWVPINVQPDSSKHLPASSSFPFLTGSLIRLELPPKARG